MKHSSIGKRKLLTMDEVLRLPIEKSLIILRGQKVLKVDKFDYTLHPEAKSLIPSKASEHIPARSLNTSAQIPKHKKEPESQTQNINVPQETPAVKNEPVKQVIEKVDFNDIFK